MSRIAYYRVSASDQSIESQRAALGGGFDKEFQDEGVSGAVPAIERAGFAQLLAYVREGDSIHVYAVDRLGRDALDVQQVVRDLLKRGIAIEIHGLGRIAAGVGELILAVLAQVADMERNRIRDRTEAGRAVARELLATTGQTQHGKLSLGRPAAANAEEVKEWRRANSASVSETAKYFGISTSSVNRYCRKQQ